MYTFRDNHQQMTEDAMQSPEMSTLLPAFALVLQKINILFLVFQYQLKTMDMMD